MTDERKADQTDERIDDLEVDAAETSQVKGGVRKAGGEQQEYLQVKLENVQITSYQIG